MGKKSFTVILLLAASTLLGTVAAQTITGKLNNTNRQAIDGATVILQTPDSLFMEAAISNADGVFLFHQQPEAYRLIVQHLAYQTLQHEDNRSNVGILTLTPREQQLEEVVVHGECPLVKVEKGVLTYDIEQLNATHLASNAYEAIRQLPGVMEQDDILTLAGAGSVHLLINGRPSSMTYEQTVTLLKATPVTHLTRAEVMYITPPRFHVRGASIHIILKGYKQGESSWQGEANAGFLQKAKAGGEGGIALLYTSPKLNMDFNYQTRNEETRTDLTLQTLHTVVGEQYAITQESYNRERSWEHTLHSGMNFQPNITHNLYVGYTTSFSPDDKGTSRSQGNFSDSFNEKTSRQQMHNVALNYTAKFGLQAGVDYTRFSQKETQHFSEAADGNSKKNLSSNFINQSEQQIDRWKVYADQSHSLPASWTLNYGTSFAYVHNRNSQQYNIPEMNGLNLDNRIREYTYNVYSGLNKSFNPQWSMSATAAVEYYQMEDYRKWAVYPTLQLNYVPSASHFLQLSFDADKTYPDYWILSGSTSYLNSYCVIQGNEWLRPSTEYSATLMYVWKNKYILQAGYNYAPDYFTQTLCLDSKELRAIYNWQNWDYTQQFTLTAVIPFKVGTWWSSRLMGNAVFKHDKASRYYDAPFDHKGWIGIGQWSNMFTLSKQPDIKMEVTAFGQTKGIQGSYTIEPIYFVDAALRYTFLKGKAMLQLKGTDLFNTMQPKTQVRNGLQHFDMGTRSYTQGMTLTFRYQFGGYKKKEQKSVDTSRFGK